ncbi:MAG: Mur ligase family protein [bacterium]
MQLKIKLKNWWFTPKLPDVHIEVKGGSEIKTYFSKWIFQPPKRWLAYFYLKFLRRFFGLKVIGITGSAGKTTTKEMVASILKLEAPTVWSKKNIDPIYNIPDTILRCLPRTKYLVLEMGVEYPGEMDFYLWLAKPDIGVITNIFVTHTEFLGSIDGVFKEKSKLVLNLDKNSFAVLNKGDFRLRKLTQSLKAKVVWFGSKGDPLKQNSQAAETVAGCLNVSSAKIVEGIKNYEKPKHRLDIIHHNSGAVVLDDSYNSNPQAMLAILKVFDKLAGKNPKVAVLGDMLELGKLEEESHRLVGREVARLNFDLVIGVGKAIKFLLSEIDKNSPKTKIIFLSNVDEVYGRFKSFLRPKVYVLIKGSRSIGLDKLADALSAD